MIQNLWEDGWDGTFPTVPVGGTVYLDFDGASVAYRGELLELPSVTVAESGLSAERIDWIVDWLNRAFASVGVTFCEAGCPAAEESAGGGSTVYVGRSGDFAGLGEFLGLSETIDVGNRRNDDNAFVFAEAEFSDRDIAGLIAHETGHLLGWSHGETGTLADYAATVAEGESDVTEGKYQNCGSLTETLTVTGDVRYPISYSFGGVSYKYYDSDGFSFVAASSAVTIGVVKGDANAVFTLDDEKYSLYGTPTPLLSFKMNSRTARTVAVTPGKTYYINLMGNFSRTPSGYKFTVTPKSSGGGAAGAGRLPDLRSGKAKGWPSGVIVHRSEGRRDTAVNSAEHAYLDFCVRNGGSGAAAGFSVRIYDGETLRNTIGFGSLAVGAVDFRTDIDLGVLSAGRHRVKIVLDSAGVLHEKSVKNNMIVKTVTVRDATPPGVVTGVSARQGSGYTVTVGFSAATDNVKVAGYRIVYWRSGAEYSRMVRTSRTSVTLKNLSMGTYRLTVSAVDSAGNAGAASSTTTVRVADATPPSEVTVKGRLVLGMLSLTWKMPKDNVGVDHYELRYGDNLENRVEIGRGLTSHTVFDLSGRTVRYQIFAVDAAGNRSRAAVHRATERFPTALGRCSSAIGAAEKGENWIASAALSEIVPEVVPERFDADVPLPAGVLGLTEKAGGGILA